MDLFLCLQFPRSAAKSHSQTQIESHLSLALRGLEATQYQVHELVTAVKEQSQQIERQSQQIERQSQQIERQSQQIERQSQRIKKLISKDKEQSEKMERPMPTTQELPLQRGCGSMNQIFPTPFEWNITEATSKTLFSEPFYLFKGGYKYKMKFGFRGMVINASIKVVPGKFDDSLSWPCKEKVHVTVLGQRKPPYHSFKKSAVIDLEKGKEPCSRPLHDDHHEYRLISELQYNLYSLIFWQYDTILLRVNRE